MTVPDRAVDKGELYRPTRLTRHHEGSSLRREFIVAGLLSGPYGRKGTLVVHIRCSWVIDASESLCLQASIA